MKNKDIQQQPISGGQALVETLKSLGVRLVFAYPGGASLPIFDALYESDLQVVLARHEQGATHMADGYARATGEVGVVLVTSGPGATNTLTGMYTARMDSSPLLVLCGQVARSSLGKDGFQEVDIFGMSLPVVKHSYSVHETKDIPHILEEGFQIARTGRPGPVLVDLPKDVTAAQLSRNKFIHVSCSHRKKDLHPQLGNEDFVKLQKMFEDSKKPLVLVGQGAILSGAQDVLHQWVEKLQVPVVNTLLGKGAFSETHPLNLGMLGMHGTGYANRAVVECDLICSIGSRWDDRIVGTYETFCPTAKKIHIDLDASEVGKVIKPDLAVIADAKAALEKMLGLGRPLATHAWLRRLTEMRQDYPLQVDSSSGSLTAPLVLQRLYEVTQGDCVLATDVGQHQMWAAQFFKVHKSRSWLSSGGAGTMGFGFSGCHWCSIGQTSGNGGGCCG